MVPCASLNTYIRKVLLDSHVIRSNWFAISTTNEPGLNPVYLDLKVHCYFRYLPFPVFKTCLISPHQHSVSPVWCGNRYKPDIDKRYDSLFLQDVSVHVFRHLFKELCELHGKIGTIYPQSSPLICEGISQLVEYRDPILQCNRYYPWMNSWKESEVASTLVGQHLCL